MPKTLRTNLNRLVAGAVAATAAVTVAAPGTPARAAFTQSPPLPSAAQAAIVVGGTSSPSLTPDVMEGFTNTFSDALYNVGYPAELWPFTTGLTLGESVAAGASALASVIVAGLNVSETLVVWGISQGALVVTAGLEALAVGADLSRLTLVRVADPATPVTGVLNAVPQNILDILRYRPAAAPNFNEIVIVNEYDGFAHFPLRPDPVAVLNALTGAWYRHAQTAYVRLAEVPAGNVTVVPHANGTTSTTYLVPATRLPLTQPLRDIGVPDVYVDGLDSTLRPMIDAAYEPLPAAAPSRAQTIREKPRANRARAVRTATVAEPENPGARSAVRSRAVRR